eukprot:7589939-Pyramimonas_sp.AAC.1
MEDCAALSRAWYTLASSRLLQSTYTRCRCTSLPSSWAWRSLSWMLIIVQERCSFCLGFPMGGSISIAGTCASTRALNPTPS